MSFSLINIIVEIDYVVVVNMVTSGSYLIPLL